MTAYPPLPKSFKKKYPFSLATTSFIYPDQYLPNVRMLGPFLDEIEVLLFESRWPDSLPPEMMISELAQAGQAFDLTYNIHLPTDVSLSDPQASNRKQSAEILRSFIRRCLPLSPSAFALHLPCEFPLQDKNDIQQWQKRCADGLAVLLDAVPDSRMLAVETLMYPFEIAESLIREFDLSVCMDTGHLMLCGFDVKTFWERHADRIPLMHLHGVREGKDHLSLDNLSAAQADIIREILKNFKGVVSLEVFSYKHLLPSLAFLEKILLSE
ncbi:MAG: cobamide remodeling phosphodiesterase CbiR [Desulfobacterales bacterium]